MERSILTSTYVTERGRSWRIWNDFDPRIDYPNLIDRYNQDTYIEEIFPTVRGYYFSQTVERHIVLHTRTPHPLLYIPPTAPTDPFRITQYQFNAVLEQTDDAFLLFTFELAHLLFADGRLDTNEWDTSRLIHQTFRQAAAISTYRLQILADLEAAVRPIAIVRSHVPRIVDYYHHILSQTRLYTTLRDISFEAVLVLRHTWENDFGRTFPYDYDENGPGTIPGYVQPEIEQELVGQRESFGSDEEEEEEPEFIYCNRYYHYIRTIHRNRASFLRNLDTTQ